MPDNNANPLIQLQPDGKAPVISYNIPEPSVIQVEATLAYYSILRSSLPPPKLRQNGRTR